MEAESHKRSAGAIAAISCRVGKATGRERARLRAHHYQREEKWWARREVAPLPTLRQKWVGVEVWRR
jgi:hypothetical protein